MFCKNDKMCSKEHHIFTKLVREVMFLLQQPQLHSSTFGKDYTIYCHIPTQASKRFVIYFTTE